MTQDEIIRMAREAGFHIENWSFGERASVYESGKTIDITNELKDFAALVAAHEREACAKVCDEQFEKYGCVADKCAAAIRTLNNKE